MSRTLNRRSGFTLLETAIVLAIVGLILGGVLVGQHMIKASELNSIASQFTEYRKIFDSFQERYNALPGDITNATDYWSACVDDGANTCNGDGNFRIGAPLTTESLRFWQHLALAEMLPIQFTGVYSVPTAIVLPGKNAPQETSVSGVYWTNNSNFGSFTYHNYIRLGSMTATTPSYPDNGVVTPSEAYSIDIKMDDGLPLAGTIMVSNQSGTEQCYSTSPDQYILTETRPYCILVSLLD